MPIGDAIVMNPENGYDELRRQLRTSASKGVQHPRRRENQMSTEPATMNWRNYVGRFSVEFEVANHEDVVQAKKGFLPPEHVRRSRISGIADTGAARLVLPPRW
jgi:hypothetical protein